MHSGGDAMKAHCECLPLFTMLCNSPTTLSGKVNGDTMGTAQQNVAGGSTWLAVTLFGVLK